MTQPTKPSAGALRAAIRINLDWTEGTNVMAHIIDRETGMAELTKILLLLWGEVEVASDEERQCQFSLEEIEQIEQAIAKCEGR